MSDTICYGCEINSCCLFKHSLECIENLEKQNPSSKGETQRLYNKQKDLFKEYDPEPGFRKNLEL